MSQCKRYQPGVAFAGDTRDWRAEAAARTAEANFHRRTLALESRYVPPPDDGEDDPTPETTEQSEMTTTTTALDRAEQMFARNAPLTDGRPCKSVFNSVAALASYLADKDREAGYRNAPRAMNRHKIEPED
jgi:hypothetical protein